MAFKISRTTFDKWVALTGVALVMLQLLLLAYSPIHVAVVVLSVLLIYVGIWRLATHLLPDRRVYRPLRSEVDEFIKLVRKLNAERARGDDPAASETSAELRETVERVITAAGVQDESGKGMKAEPQRRATEPA